MLLIQVWINVKSVGGTRSKVYGHVYLETTLTVTYQQFTIMYTQRKTMFERCLHYTCIVGKKEFPTFSFKLIVVKDDALIPFASIIICFFHFTHILSATTVFRLHKQDGSSEFHLHLLVINTAYLDSCNGNRST